jgi:beta-1,2-mannobiose phosphorylase / 1,2-beta-oligomannan phosphorylase
MKLIKSAFPVLSPREDLPWASGAVFNPGAWAGDGKVHMLFRSIPKGYKSITLDDSPPGEPDTGFDDNYISRIGYAVSEDGVHFTWRDTPFIDPGEPFNAFGAEDPRISKIDDLYLVTYTALHRPAYDPVDGVRIALAVTRDFKTIESNTIAGPPDHRDKDAVIFPERINGKIVMLHRIVPDIQIISFDSLDQLINPPAGMWEGHMANLGDHILMRPEFDWEEKKVGAGPTPVKTDKGWLLIYHGVDRNHVYRMGVALLDLRDPRRIIARANVPVLEPELDFELHGDVPNVVFPEGAVVIDGMLHVYYGAADRVIGHARIPLVELLEWLLTFKHINV